MKPEIMKKEFLLVGLETQIDFSKDFSKTLEDLRETLRQNLNQIPNTSAPVRMVGFWQPGGCYFTGVEVSEEAPVPKDLIVKALPESLFVKFREEKRGTVGGPGGYAYNQWLPESGFRVNEELPGDFEIFDDMEHCDEDDGCDILIPIRPNAVDQKQIRGVVPFPCDAESDSFFGALASALLPILGYSEETPYWCPPKAAYCIGCGGCGDKTTLQKHQLSVYHALLTATGTAFGFDYPEDDEVDCHSFEDVEIGWRWPDAFIGYIMGLAGLTWKRITWDADQSEIYKAITASIDRGYPVLARLGGHGVFPGETAWQVVTGYKDGALCGLDANSLSETAAYSDGLFLLQNWQDSFIDAVIITGHQEKSVAYMDVLDRIIRTLSHPSHAKLENDIMAKLDAVTPENAEETAMMMCGITGVPIEARWHAAEAFCSMDNMISCLTEEQALKSRLSDLFFKKYIADHNDETHGVCWKIWGLLGVGPETGYWITPESAERLLNPETRNEIKRLFRIVFDNDRAVLAELTAVCKGGGGDPVPKKMIPNLPAHPMISNMAGQNYWLNGCMAYLMECLGESPDYDYWFFSGVTGDSFLQVYGKNPEQMVLCYSDIMTDTALKKAFDACGYGYAYDKITEGNREMLGKRIRESIDRNIPVIARVENTFRSFAVICGYDAERFYSIMGEETTPAAYSYSNLIFVGDKKEQPALAVAYKDAVLAVPALMTIQETEDYSFGEKAFIDWAESLEDGRYQKYPAESKLFHTHGDPSFTCWNMHGTYLCMLGTNLCAVDFLKKAYEFNTELTFIEQLLPIYEKQCGKGFMELIGMEGGFSLPPEAIRDSARMKPVSDAIKKAGSYCGDILKVFEQEISEPVSL